MKEDEGQEKEEKVAATARSRSWRERKHSDEKQPEEPERGPAEKKRVEEKTKARGHQAERDKKRPKEDTTADAQRSGKPEKEIENRTGTGARRGDKRAQRRATVRQGSKGEAKDGGRRKDAQRGNGRDAGGEWRGSG